MKVTSADFDMLIPYYRQTAMYCLFSGIGTVTVALAIVVVGWVVKNNMFFGGAGAVIGMVGFVPFQLYFARLEKVKLLAQVQAVSARGGEIPEATNEVLIHMLMGSS